MDKREIKTKRSIKNAFLKLRSKKVSNKLLSKNLQRKLKSAKQLSTCIIGIFMIYPIRLVRK